MDTNNSTSRERKPYTLPETRNVKLIRYQDKVMLKLILNRLKTTVKDLLAEEQAET